MSQQQHLSFDRLSRHDHAMDFQFSAEAEQHLATCAQCQTQLKSITADDSWWQKASDYLHLDELDSELTSADLQMNNSAMLDEESASQLDAIQELTDSSILDQAAHPEMLGRIGHYDIEKVIGRGGMGVVYKGYDTQLNRSVAIKVLSPHLGGNGVARKRFSREARAAAAVVHPNVIPIHGVNSEGKLPYIVMPLVAGQSLQSHVEEHGPLETKDIVRIAMQIAAGLDAAHNQGLVHRDIKPANILMEDDVSRVMITDFGLARAADDAAMTQTGWLAGTPHYMSPEQSRGKSVGPESDLFSLGSVMYFMATGRVPFRADGPVAVLNLICNETSIPARQINSDIPRWLNDVIDKLLEKKPADRFHSAGQLQQYLEGHLAHLQHPQSKPAPKKLITRKQIRRRSYGAIVAAGCLILLAAVYLFLPTPSANHSPPESTSEKPAGDMQALTASLGVNVMPVEEFETRIGELRQEIEALEKRLFSAESLNSPIPTNRNRFLQNGQFPNNGWLPDANEREPSPTEGKEDSIPPSVVPESQNENRSHDQATLLRSEVNEFELSDFENSNLAITDNQIYYSIFYSKRQR